MRFFGIFPFFLPFFSIGFLGVWGIWGGLPGVSQGGPRGVPGNCAKLCIFVHFWGGPPGGQKVVYRELGDFQKWVLGGPGGCARACAKMCIFRPPPRGVSGGVLGGSRGCGGAGGGDGLNSSPSFLVEVGHSSRRPDRPNDQPSICSVSFKTWSAIVGGD